MKKKVKDLVINFFFFTFVRPKDKKKIFRVENINEEPSFLVIRLGQIHRTIEVPSHYLRIQQGRNPFDLRIFFIVCPCFWKQKSPDSWGGFISKHAAQLQSQLHREWGEERCQNESLKIISVRLLCIFNCISIREQFQRLRLDLQLSINRNFSFSLTITSVLKFHFYSFLQ